MDYPGIGMTKARTERMDGLGGMLNQCFAASEDLEKHITVLSEKIESVLSPSMRGDQVARGEPANGAPTPEPSQLGQDARNLLMQLRKLSYRVSELTERVDLP